MAAGRHEGLHWPIAQAGQWLTANCWMNGWVSLARKTISQFCRFGTEFLGPPMIFHKHQICGHLMQIVYHVSFAADGIWSSMASFGNKKLAYWDAILFLGPATTTYGRSPANSSFSFRNGLPTPFTTWTHTNEINFSTLSPRGTKHKHNKHSRGRTPSNNTWTAHPQSLNFIVTDLRRDT